MNRNRCMIYSMKVLAWMLILPLSAHAGEWWTDDAVTNYSMLAANTMLVADWAQTRRISNSKAKENGFGYREVGMAEDFIGEHPSTGDVNEFFAKTILLTNLVGYLLPEKYKGMFYVGVASFEAGVVSDNHEIGIKMQF